MGTANSEQDREVAAPPRHVKGGPAARRALASAVGGLLVAATINVTAQGRFENPPVFGASAILPPELVSGPNHRVDERVENDGFMNTYRLQSRFGTLDVVSAATLRKRVAEINAIAGMEQIKGSEEFASALVKVGGDVVRGAINLVTDPVNTVSGTITGVGRMFRRAGDSLFGDPKSDTEDDALSAALGRSETKRKYAAAFGVDVYSANPLLQEQLDDVSRAGFLGELVGRVGLIAVPGGAGIAVSVSGGTKRVNDALRTLPPTDLRRMNRKKLEGMGVNGTVIDLFFGNTVFSPTQQTYLVGALEEMGGTADREQFIRFAVLTDDVDVAIFRRRQAQMYAGYHRSVAPIQRFVPVGELTAAVTTTGVLVFNVPLDYLAWTRDIAMFGRWALRPAYDVKGVIDREIWFAGTVSAMARKELEARGWKVTDRAEARLLGGGS